MPLRRVITTPGLFRCHHCPTQGGVALGKAASLRAFSSTSHLRLLHARGPFAGPEPTTDTFRPLTGRIQLDYAKSARSNCSMCGFGISEAALRVGTDVQGAGDFSITAWQHPRCFTTITMPVYPDLRLYTDADIAIKKVSSVMPSDRDAVARLLTGDACCSWDALLGALFPVAADRAAFDKQLEAVRVAKEDLAAWPVEEILLLWEANVAPAAAEKRRQSTRKPDREAYASRVASMLLYGPAAPCQACGGGELSAVDATGDFSCSGHFDAFTKCGAVVAAGALSRSPLVVPPPLQQRVGAFFKAVAKKCGISGTDTAVLGPLFDQQLVIGHIVKRAAAHWFALNEKKTSCVPSPPASDARKGKQTKGKKSKKGSAAPPAHVTLASQARPYEGFNFVVERSASNTSTASNAGLVATAPWDAVSARGGAVCTADSFFGSKKGDAKAKDSPSIVWDGTMHLVSDPPHADRTTPLIPTISSDWVAESLRVGRPLSVREGYTYYKEDRRPPAADAKWISNVESYKTKALAESAASSASASAAAAPTSTTAAASDASSSTIAFTGTAPVDPESGLAATHSVYHSDVNNLPVSATLSSVDLGTDKNSFYVLQVLVDNDASSDTPFVVFRRWGRLGDPLKGGVTTEKFANRHTALNKFAKYFFDRTDNSWLPFTLEHVKQFVKKPGKYNWVDRPHGDDEDVSAPSEGETAKKKKVAGAALPSAPAIVLPPETRNLMSLLFSEESIQRSMATMSIDTKKMPLPGLNARAVKEGRHALHELMRTVAEAQALPLAAVDGPTEKKSSKKGKAAPRKAQGGKGTPAGAEAAGKTMSVAAGEANAASQQNRQRQILSLSNQFYSHIPHIRSEDATDAFLLDSLDKIAPKFQLLDDLEDILLTKRLMIQQSRDAQDPRLAQYKQLGVDLIPMARQSCDEAKLIERYFENSHGSTHSKFKLKQLWKLSRNGEEQRFDPWKAFPNRKLLWHGSRLTNWVRILSTGLKIAPPDAPVSGYMFGKGIYFADMVSKSANYCHMQRGGSEGGLLAV